MSDVDPTLLAVSDLLVLEALTRGWARTVKRSGRSVPPVARHNQYLRTPVTEDRIDSVMHDAWVLCPLLAQRHNLPVDTQDWADRLDGYTRALLMMSMPHSLQRLTELLVGVSQAADRTEWDAEDG